jgi:hypothetical protein
MTGAQDCHGRAVDIGSDISPVSLIREEGDEKARVVLIQNLQIDHPIRCKKISLSLAAKPAPHYAPRHEAPSHRSNLPLHSVAHNNS